MKRILSTALVAALTAAPVFAQAPAGWQVRADRSTSATDPDGAGDIKFTTIPGGFRATNPTAASCWNPAATRTSTDCSLAAAPSRVRIRAISTSSWRRMARSSFGNVRAIACPIRTRRREAAAAVVRRLLPRTSRVRSTRQFASLGRTAHLRTRSKFASPATP
jgi:hypothetical protein